MSLRLPLVRVIGGISQMSTMRSLQRGSVSLFVVIFAALLIITIVTAFMRIMIQDQMQATANDLSKSAYDSAQAGVEDAKRAIVEFYERDCQNRAPSEDARCDSLRAALVGNATVDDGWTTGCQATTSAGVAVLSDGEVRVKTSNVDDSLDQAYTCVKIQMNPIDYVGALTPGTSRVVQLKAKDNAAFGQIKLQWYAHQDQSVDLTSDVAPYPLPDQWPDNRPAVMRVQLVQYESEFRLSDFDSDSAHNSTLFLLPATVGASTTAPTSFTNDFRQNRDSAAAQPVACSPSPTGSRYACEVTITLPDLGNPSERTAYLKVSQFYSTGNTGFRITMLDGTSQEVRFADVQPAVDVTGRASDLFRRIRSRIDLGTSSIPNLEAAVDVTRSLCKEFLVTNDRAYPGNSGVCPVPPSGP